MKQPQVFVSLDRENIEAYTPRYAVDIIVPYLQKEKVIWAPFSKDEHHFANYLREQGFQVINTHLDAGADFLTYQPDFHFDIILDNPPFKNKTKFVAKAISYGKPFALFLPFNSFGDNGIPRLFIENGIEPQMLIPDRRTEFENQESKGISFKTVYICSGVLPKQIIFTSLVIPKPTQKHPQTIV
jgi:hypothetical protein